MVQASADLLVELALVELAVLAPAELSISLGPQERQDPHQARLVEDLVAPAPPTAQWRQR